MPRGPIRIDILPNYAFTAKGYYKQLPDGTWQKVSAKLVNEALHNRTTRRKKGDRVVAIAKRAG